MFGLVTQKTHQRALIQMSNDICDIQNAMTAQIASANDLRSYPGQVKALAEMYNGCAAWGNQLAQNLINVRAAFICANGLKVSATEKGKGVKELAFINDFMKHNNLDEEVAQNWAREAEIEGKFLARPIWNDKAKGTKLRPLKGMAEVRYVPWTDTNYTVKTLDEDYGVITGVEYNSKAGSLVNLKPGEFVYARFGGRTHQVNTTPPKLGALIATMQNIDKALTDWRKINHLFAAPTPYFKCATEGEVTKTLDRLKNLTWRIGKLLAGTADFSLVGPPAESKAAISEEITMNVKFLSGGSGCPVHFFGFPDLMSNRSTADNLMEMIFAATSKERHVWIGFYEQLFATVIAMANEKLSDNMDPNAIQVDIPVISQAHMKELVEVWLPLYVAGAIDLETFLSKVPDVDAEKVMDSLKDAQQENPLPKVKDDPNIEQEAA